MAVIAITASNRLMSTSRDPSVRHLLPPDKDSKQATLLYHHVGRSEQPIRHDKAERLRGLEVDNQKPRVPDAVQRETKWSGAPLIRTATDWDDPGSAAHHFASLVLRCARDTSLILAPYTFRGDDGTESGAARNARTAPCRTVGRCGALLPLFRLVGVPYIAALWRVESLTRHHGDRPKLGWLR